jgi:hypothetical protein
MKYTVRFAHMKETPKWKRGDVIKTGDVIGTMGSSGQSTAAHLHIDCAQGEQARLYQLVDYDVSINPAPRQLLHFIDDDLFGVAPVITTGYADYEYWASRGKVHHGFDVVPVDRRATQKHFDIHWNRSVNGIVSAVLDEPKSYGHCLYVTFDI